MAAPSVCGTQAELSHLILRTPMESGGGVRDLVPRGISREGREWEETCIFRA